MDYRIGLGLAGGVGLLALGAWALSRRDEGADAPSPGPADPHAGHRTPSRSPGPAPQSTTGRGPTLDAWTDELFARYDKDADGTIEIGARPYDLDIQEPSRTTTAEVEAWAATDERVFEYDGDVEGNGHTLPVLTDLPFLMHVAQGHSPTPQTSILDLRVTRPMVLDALVKMYDADRDRHLSGPELAKLGADYPAQKINFRFVRVINEGEWRAADDHDHPLVDVPDDVTNPGGHHQHAAGGGVRPADGSGH